MKLKKINIDIVIEQVMHDCLCEMYKKAQPSADYDEYVRKLKSGELKEERGKEIYRRHYLPRKQYYSILNKYIDAFKLKDRWNDHIDMVIDYLGENAKEEVSVRKDGFPPTREYRQLDDISVIFEDCLKTKFATLIGFEISEEELNEVSNELKEALLQRIETCRTHFRSDYEVSYFEFNIASVSPTLNKEEVIDYWKTKGVDIEIIDRDTDEYYDEQNE